MSILTSYLDKSISILHFGNRWNSSLCADLAESARTVSYVETVGNKADTLHQYVKRVDEQSLKRSFGLQVLKAIKKLRLKRVELAIDTTKDPYYGKELLKTRRTKHEKGTDCVWEYVQLSIVWPIHLPLMAIPYPAGTDLASLAIELLEYAKSLPLKVIKVLFDRGFYIWHLIDYLESIKNKDHLPYLILVPQNGKVRELVSQTKKIEAYKHFGYYAKKKSTWKPHTTLVVCKDAGVDKKNKPYHLVFATNLKPSYSLVGQYRRRWNIETGFRVMKEGKIKTKSNNPLIRLFYFLLRSLFTLIWMLQNCLQQWMTFKRFLREIEKELRKLEVYKPPPIVPLF